MLATQLNHYVTSNQITEGTYMRLDEMCVSDLNSRKYALHPLPYLVQAVLQGSCYGVVHDSPVCFAPIAPAEFLAPLLCVPAV